MNKQMNVEQWVAMFREIGLSEEKMSQWHKLFESRHPEAHQEFLEWLGLPKTKIEQIRANSRS
jgi:hypothetical protein